MPTPSQNYQASLNGLLMGEDSDYLFGRGNIDGLGNPPSKTAEVELDGQDGVYASPEYFDARTVLMHIEIVADTDTDAFEALTLLKVAWVPTVATVDLHIQLPGWGHFYYSGHPRGVEVDLANVHQGHISCICEFRATDPRANVA